jgi:integrase
MAAPTRKKVDRNLYQRSTGAFEAVYRESGTGKQRLKVLEAKTLRAARKERDALIVQRDRREDVAPSRSTLNDLADSFFEEYEARVERGERSRRALDTARQRYDSHIRKTLGLRRAQEIRSSTVSQWLADLRKTSLSNHTVRGIVTVLSAVCTKAVRDEVITGNPVAKLRGTLPPAKSKTKARVLTVEEVTNLIDSAAATSQRNGTMVATACFTGMRQSELLGLRWQDVDFDGSKLHVRNQLSRATKDHPASLVSLKSDAAERSIDLAPGLARELRLLKAKASTIDPSAFVFTTGIGTPVYYRNANRDVLDPAADRAGLNPEGAQKLSWHDLRHTAISHLIRAGIDPVRVSKFAGHAKVSITLDVYSHEFEAQAGEGAGAALGAVLGGAR